MIPDESSRTVRLPVCWRDGKLTLDNGSLLPEINQNASGELILSALDLVDEDQRAIWTGERVVDFLAVSTPLFARVSANFLPAEMAGLTVEKFHHRRRAAFVPLVLDHPVRLVVVPGKKGYMIGGKCHCPNFKLEANSLNEALRKVSEHFEPTRRSYGGNAFELIYAEIKHRLVKLADYRDQIRDEMERQHSGPQSPDSNRPSPSDHSTYGPQQQLDF